MSVLNEGFILKVFKTIPAFMKALMEGMLHNIVYKNDSAGEVCEKLNKTQRKTLMYLNLEGDSPLTEIAKVMNLEKGSVTTLVDSLEKYELVTRERDPGDRRKMIVTMTPKGKEITNRMQDYMGKYVKKKMEVLSDEDLVRLTDAIDTLADIVEKLKGDGNG